MYRLYSADERLLYVGVSRNPENRLKEHRRDKPWFHEVALYTVTWFESEGDAYRAETLNIQNCGPRYNVTHNEEWSEAKAAVGDLLCPGVLARMFVRRPLAEAMASMYLGGASASAAWSTSEILLAFALQ